MSCKKMVQSLLYKYILQRVLYDLFIFNVLASFVFYLAQSRLDRFLISNIIQPYSENHKIATARNADL